jgi:integrase
VFPRVRGIDISPKRQRRVGAGHFVGIERVWQRVRVKAMLDNVRLHDLRHTFASWSVMDGVPLYVTGQLLGHKNASTTERYSHVANDPIQAAADKVSAKLAAALAGGKKGQVVPLRKPSRTKPSTQIG